MLHALVIYPNFCQLKTNNRILAQSKNLCLSLYLKLNLYRWPAIQLTKRPSMTRHWKLQQRLTLPSMIMIHLLPHLQVLPPLPFQMKRLTLSQISPKILEAIASFTWRNFSLWNTDTLIGCTYWSTPNIRGSFAAEHCPKRMNAWTDFLLTLYPLVFNVLPANLLDHLTNAEKRFVRSFVLQCFLCTSFLCIFPWYFHFSSQAIFCFPQFVATMALLDPFKLMGLKLWVS